MGVSPKPRRRERKDCRAISGIPEWHASVSSQSARTKAAVSSVDPRRSPPQPPGVGIHGGSEIWIETKPEAGERESRRIGGRT